MAILWGYPIQPIFEIAGIISDSPLRTTTNYVSSPSVRPRLPVATSMPDASEYTKGGAAAPPFFRSRLRALRLARGHRRSRCSGHAAVQIDVNRAVTPREHRRTARLVADDDVRPPVAVHVGDLDVVVRVRLDLQSFDRGPSESALPVSEKDLGAARIGPRVDDVEIAVAVEVTRGQAPHAA